MNDNKDLKKIIILALITNIIMYSLPYILISIFNYYNPGDLEAISYIIWLFLGLGFIFFILFPIVAVVLGYVAGTNIKKLWWIPLIPVVMFIILNWNYLKEFDVENFFLLFIQL